MMIQQFLYSFMRLSLIIFLLSAHSVFGQSDYTSSVPKAVRAFETALQFYDTRQNEKALNAVNEAIAADDKFVEAHMLKANVLSDMKQYEEAIVSYKNAIAINPGFFPNNYFSLGKTEYLAGNYADARLSLQQFIETPKAGRDLVRAAKQLIINASFAEQAVSSPVPFTPVNMGSNINSTDEEYFPAITADGKTFLFTRRMKSISQSGAPSQQEDFYVSYKDTAWRSAQALTEINTSGNEGAPSLSADGQYLFFTACEEIISGTDARKTKGSCDIFLAKKIGDKFNRPRNLEAPINTNTWESQPSFSSDGRTLYFVRKMRDKSGYEQRDILVTRIGDNSEWSEPVSVSDRINTTGDEISVFIHPDDQTLYFSSDGHPGMGGQDIFMSKRDSTGDWGEPVNLGYPINTTRDENSLLVSPDGETAFFASNREGGFGGLDIYKFSLHEKARPQPVTYMKGKVYDVETKKMLGASFELIDLASGKTVVSSTSNSVSGEFIVALPTGKSYALNVSKDGYLFYSENFELKHVKSAKDPFLKDVPMKPIKAGESIVLKNIFFETDKYELKNESKIELNKLVTFLGKNPKIKFEVSGHTDNVGTPQYNQGLSERRARSVYAYLLSKGIAADRMISAGYGDTKPVADNKSEAGRAQNRRTEFKIVSI